MRHINIMVQQRETQASIQIAIVKLKIWKPFKKRESIAVIKDKKYFQDSQGIQIVDCTNKKLLQV